MLNRLNFLILMTMDMIINDAETLRRYIPNVIKEVKGEVPLFDRMRYFLGIAQDWFCRFFAPEEMLDKLDLAPAIIAAEAFRLAVPKLDVVITPNGFATVGTQNLSPASKMRVDRLAGGLMAERDKAVDLILKVLPTVEGWTQTRQGRWFSATLFQNLDVVAQTGCNERIWDKFMELRPKIIDIEADLAEEWLSAELLDALRSELMQGVLSDKRKRVVVLTQAQIVECLISGSLSCRRLADIVNFIRSDESDFPEWHSSETAALFSPKVFRNKKNSSGYFF